MPLSNLEYPEGFARNRLVGEMYSTWWLLELDLKLTHSDACFLNARILIATNRPEESESGKLYNTLKSFPHFSWPPRQKLPVNTVGTDVSFESPKQDHAALMEASNNNEVDKKIEKDAINLGSETQIKHGKFETTVVNEKAQKCRKSTDSHVQYVTFQERTKSSSLSKSSLDKAIVK
jgi:hypothetical protein